MIAKAVKGKGFRGALEYDLTKEAGRVINTNMTGRGARELAAEFGEIRKLRPGLSKAVLHVSLSAAPGEHLADSDWIKIGERYLDGMGLNRNQYVITRHTDTDHEHIHILANRIQFDGVVTSDSHDYRRQEILMRAIERDLGLRQVAMSFETERRAATKGEIEEGLRTGRPSTRLQLQQLCDAAAKDCGDFATYAARLESAGVNLVPVTQLDDSKLSGLSYLLDGVVMKGSDLGKRYSPSGLAKYGVSYDEERDFATVGRCIERSKIGRPGTADRGAAVGSDRERGTTGIDPRTAGAGNGGVDGRDARCPSGNGPPEPGTGRTIQERGPTGDDGAKQGVDTRRTSGGVPTASWPLDGMDPLFVDRGDRGDNCAPRERILALAGTADRGELPGREGSGRRVAPRDRTLEAIRRQVALMGVSRYEIVLIDAKCKKEQRREWSVVELARSVAWLKRMNARGNDVFVRPVGEHGLVLLDGLRDEMLTTMRSEGFDPAVVVQTEPGRYQVNRHDICRHS